MVGGLGALFNGIGRLFWGAVVDVFGFERPYGVLAALQAVLMVLLPISTVSRQAFAVIACMLFFCLGGNFWWVCGVCVGCVWSA